MEIYVYLYVTHDSVSIAIFKNNTKMEHSTSTHHKSGTLSQAMTELTNDMDYEHAATI